MDGIAAFLDGLEPGRRAICERLSALIDGALPRAVSKLYHGSPVWFLDDNPIVGYSEKKAGISLLFWSGQGFQAGGLAAAGKHKAAEAIFATADDIDGAKVRNWLEESVLIQWNYKDIVKHKGRLERLG